MVQFVEPAVDLGVAAEGGREGLVGEEPVGNGLVVDKDALGADGEGAFGAVEGAGGEGKFLGGCPDVAGGRGPSARKRWRKSAAWSRGPGVAAARIWSGLKGMGPCQSSVGRPSGEPAMR